ncbi:MAG: hypothetical protein ACYC59_00520 [Anaerolineaceae bacterium]
MKKRFKFLRTLANIFKILGILLAALSLLGGIILIVLSLSNGNFWSLFGLDAATGYSVGLASGIITLVCGVLCGLMVYGFGELVYVLISIEENTYKTSVFLEGMQKDED